MRTRIFWIRQLENGARIGIMARPRGSDWLEEEVGQLKGQGVQVLVSLLEREEIAELGLSGEAGCCEKHSIEFINFPIPDRNIPKNDQQVIALVKNLAGKIDSGSSIVIHCRMGIGRSSIIAAAVLLRNGFRAKDLLQEISRVRGLAVPDTNEQVDWLSKMEGKIKN
jgi:protein-tyrosine phosphatase